MSQSEPQKQRGRGRPSSQVVVPGPGRRPRSQPSAQVVVPPVRPVVDEVPTVPVEDIGSQMDNTERNASDGDGDNGRDTEVKEDEVLGGSLILQAPVGPVPRQPSESGSLLENSRSSSGQPSEPKFSESDNSQGQPRVPGGLAQAVTPGQPSVPQSLLNIFESPFFSHNYYVKLPLEEARCLICSKIVQRKMANTAGMKIHLASSQKRISCL